MKKPKMILFDFGETLVTEKFTPVNGNRALLHRAVKNPNNVSAEEVQMFAEQLMQEIGKNTSNTEVHVYQFQKYLYDFIGVELEMSPHEMEQIFISESIVSKATQGIGGFLSFLEQMNIRTGVISNISFSGEALKNLIQKDLPFNKFEFIVASSEYIFRKPNKYIFDIALKKAGLKADEVWYCGNNFACDVLGSSNAGLQPVWYKGAKWLNNGNETDCSFIEVSDWNELEGIILKSCL